MWSIRRKLISFECNHIFQVKLWSSQLWTQFWQLRREAWKIQDLNGVWARDLAIPVRRSNQLSYEATDVGSWSFVGSNGPVSNESMMKWYLTRIIYEMNHIWTPEFFRLLYAIVKIAFITAKIIASLDFISAVHIWFISYTISSLNHIFRNRACFWVMIFGLTWNANLHRNSKIAAKASC